MSFTTTFRLLNGEGDPYAAPKYALGTCLHVPADGTRAIGMYFATDKDYMPCQIVRGYEDNKMCLAVGDRRISITSWRGPVKSKLQTVAFYECMSDGSEADTVRFLDWLLNKPDGRMLLAPDVSRVTWDTLVLKTLNPKGSEGELQIEMEALNVVLLKAAGIDRAVAAGLAVALDRGNSDYEGGVSKYNMFVIDPQDGNKRFAVAGINAVTGKLRDSAGREIIIASDGQAIYTTNADTRESPNREEPANPLQELNAEYERAVRDRDNLFPDTGDWNIANRRIADVKAKIDATLLAPEPRPSKPEPAPIPQRDDAPPAEATFEQVDTWKWILRMRNDAARLGNRILTSNYDGSLNSLRQSIINEARMRKAELLKKAYKPMHQRKLRRGGHG